VVEDGRCVALSPIEANEACAQMRVVTLNLSAIPLKRTNSRKMRLGHLQTISGGICSIGFENDCRCIPDLVFFEVHFVK